MQSIRPKQSAWSTDPDQVIEFRGAYLAIADEDLVGGQVFIREPRSKGGLVDKKLRIHFIDASRGLEADLEIWLATKATFLPLAVRYAQPKSESLRLETRTSRSLIIIVTTWKELVTQTKSRFVRFVILQPSRLITSSAAVRAAFLDRFVGIRTNRRWE